LVEAMGLLRFIAELPGERRHGLFLGHTGKICQELVERITRRQVVQQSANGDARADEDRSAPEDVGVAVEHG
jgi:hypothetical protein